jgi:hypothetical protein
MGDGGKGSKPRPISVSDEEYAARWDAIFQRDKPREAEALRKGIESENERLSMYDVYKTKKENQ